MITTWPENRFGTRIEYPTFAGDVVSGAGLTFFPDSRRHLSRTTIRGRNDSVRPIRRRGRLRSIFFLDSQRACRDVALAESYDYAVKRRVLV
jgi:hypothetical protein